MHFSVKVHLNALSFRGALLQPHLAVNVTRENDTNTASPHMRTRFIAGVLIQKIQHRPRNVLELGVCFATRRVEDTSHVFEHFLVPQRPDAFKSGSDVPANNRTLAPPNGRRSLSAPLGNTCSKRWGPETGQTQLPPSHSSPPLNLGTLNWGSGHDTIFRTHSFFPYIACWRAIFVF